MPISINIAVGIFVVTVAALLAVTFFGHKSFDMWTLTALFLNVSLRVYFVVAQLRMSRWPVFLFWISELFVVFSKFETNPHWIDRYPILGMWALLLWPALISILVLPHWNKLNWAFLGQAQPAPMRPQDVF